MPDHEKPKYSTKGDEPHRIRFDAEETQRIHDVAEYYAMWCSSHGSEPPPDPYRAVLAAAERWREVTEMAVRDVFHKSKDEPRH